MENLVQQFPPFREAEAAHGAWRSRPPRTSRAGFLAQIHFLHRPQDHRHPIRPHRAVLPAVRILPDDDDALADRASGHAGAADRAAAGKSSRPGRGQGRDFARPLQFLRRDARNHHGVSGHRAAGVRGVRQLRRAADDRRAGHDVSARQHGELSGLFHRRRHHARELFHSGRRGAGGLDFLFAAGDHDSDPRPDCSGSSA